MESDRSLVACESDMKMVLKVCEGGANMGFCEGILRCTQPKSLSIILSPREVAALR